MRSILLVTAMLAACGGAAKGPIEPTAPPTPLVPAQVVEAAKGAVEKWRQAYEVRSMDALSALYTNSLDVVLVHQGRSYAGWTAVHKHLNDLLGQARDIHVKTTDVAVVSLGNEGAQVTANVRREVSDSVTTIMETGVLTLSLRLEGERWLIVNEHFSYPPRAE